jgi:hypothetical protein
MLTQPSAAAAACPALQLILLSRPFFPNLHAVLCNLVEL